MPDSDGWHDTAFLRGDGLMYLYHYCEGAEQDTLVRDTPKERAKHLKACLARQDAEKNARARQAEERRLAALAAVRAERKLAR